MNAVALALATWFGCGYVPKGPGTAGSAAAIAIALLLSRWMDVSPCALAILGLITALVGVWAAGETAKLAGSKDPQIVVIDEVAGQWVTLAGAVSLNWKSWVAAFLLFRLFDIWKPPPIRRLESLPGGLGVMADDVMAGIYGAVVLYATGLLNWY